MGVKNRRSPAHLEHFKPFLEKLKILYYFLFFKIEFKSNLLFSPFCKIIYVTIIRIEKKNISTF